MVSKQFAITILLILLISTGIYFLYFNPRTTLSKEKAILGAKEYAPGGTGICPTRPVHGHHRFSGAEYNFGVSCLPPGWEESL